MLLLLQAAVATTATAAAAEAAAAAAATGNGADAFAFAAAATIATVASATYFASAVAAASVTVVCSAAENWIAGRFRFRLPAQPLLAKLAGPAPASPAGARHPAVPPSPPQSLVARSLRPPIMMRTTESGEMTMIILKSNQ